MHPALGVLVSVSEDRNLVIKHGEFDVTVPLLLDSVQGSDLVLTSIPVLHDRRRGKTEELKKVAFKSKSPVDLEVLVLLFWTQFVIQLDHYFLVGPSLERDRLALVVEPWNLVLICM